MGPVQVVGGAASARPFLVVAPLPSLNDPLLRSIRSTNAWYVENDPDSQFAH